MSALFRRDDKRDVAYPEGLTELEKLTYKMKNFKTVKPGKSSRNITEISLHKVSVLYDYIKAYTVSSDLDVRSNEEKEKNVKINAMMAERAHEEDEDDNGVEMDSEEENEINTYYGRVATKQEEDDFCSEYLAYDKAFVKKINENPKNKTKLKPCRCGLSSPHQSHHGSLRFCKHFINIPRYEERKQLLRTKRACSLLKVSED